MRKTAATALLVIMLSSCAPGSGEYGDNNEAGFFSGVWHGWIAPITLIVQIFNESDGLLKANKADGRGRIFIFGGDNFAPTNGNEPRRRIWSPTCLPADVVPQTAS